ncbi:MAG: sensor histidine kinase, partial [Lachnospiraceae bacterium]|nr:sensor histidine kinase [Lachnospiraceae bacterium]
EDSRAVEKLFENLEDYGRVIIENHIPSCLVYLDKLRLEQVIDNVVGNSYKYAGTDIKISFSETGPISLENGKKARFVRVIIKDFGPGVSEEDLPLICEKYYRGKNSSEQNGYGLGLYLVRLYMTKMLGGMEVYNDNGFSVELLLRKV